MGPSGYHYYSNIDCMGAMPKLILVKMQKHFAPPLVATSGEGCSSGVHCTKRPIDSKNSFYWRLAKWISEVPEVGTTMAQGYELNRIR